MNSRDAAYDEEEQLRRAIEESKEDTKSIPDETASRLGKRSRSESETYVSSDQLSRTSVADRVVTRNRQGSKRPRTTSPSPVAASTQSAPTSQPPSEDESKPEATNGPRRQRATSRVQRDKEPAKETDEVEPEAPETANRRKERSVRRKDDGKCNAPDP